MIKTINAALTKVAYRGINEQKEKIIYWNKPEAPAALKK